MKEVDNEVIKAIEKSIDIAIDYVEQVDSNKVFTILKGKVEEHVSSKRYFKDFLFVKCHEMNSIVQSPLGNTLKIQESIDFYFNDGSLVRFSPYGEGELELTRILVRKDNRRKGVGLEILNLASIIFKNILGFEPRINLECTGAIGFGNSHDEIGLDAQVSFFKKGGYQVEVYCSNPPYAHMVRGGSWGIPRPLASQTPFNVNNPQ